MRILFPFIIFGFIAPLFSNTVPHLGRGVNLGNKLEAPRGKTWGPSLETWNFKKAKEGGFDSVRLPIRWHPYASTEAPYTIEESFFAKVEKAIQDALDHDLAIVINLHHYEPLYENPEKEKPRFLALWRQIAPRFKDVPNDKVVFEILNEPHGNLNPKLWNQYLVEALAIIRESNPKRYVMIGTAKYGGIQGMRDLVLPDDKRLIFTVHFYEPFKFTHQGASWTPGGEKWCGTRWTGTEKQRAAISKKFDTVSEWAKANGNVPVNVGEFGVYQKCSDPEDQILWTEHVARESEKRGFSWTYWEFNSGFGIHGKEESDSFKPLLKALVPPTKN